ncbi:potassium transporter Kup [Bacteroidetes bacterium UKL13-3]|nr:potassium transporter Kup [Bacteroidetes bacterium UKL13-3]HCP94428.1 potassium transporter Kup [Bacteroidota bacterium]
MLVTLGIIYGDIGTSPLYVMKAIVADKVITKDLVYGGLSCIFWTLTLQTTIKYVIITLRADNNGEGGIFSLYALIRRRRPKLIFPAIVGGCALLADGVITPPISVSSAIEGLRILNPDIPTIPIVLTIITILFVIQRVGTSIVGKAFGPIMFVWFGMLAVLGISSMSAHPQILHALNPYYAYNLLYNYPEGYWLLGAVFLCTTGAEALYSDLGHCGKHNIRVSWIFVKTTLVLNYLGQGAYILQFEGQDITKMNPFFGLMPDWFLLSGIAIATLAAVIASQALISGSFTLISEALRLNVWPKVSIKYPSEAKGQLYVPSANWLLWAGCVGIVLYFKESSNMEAAYGLAITIAMLMTTILLANYLRKINAPRWFVSIILLVYISIEGSFLLANLQKFPHGGWVSVIISLGFILVMWVWFKGRKIKNRLTEFVNLKKYLPILHELSNDQSVPKYATHLVFLTSADHLMEVENKVIYSILQKQPKRADIYWFLHIHVDDQPYTMQYKVDIVVPQDVIKVEFKLGFRVEQKINFYFRKVVEELMKNGEVDVTSRYASLNKQNITGDFRFVVLKRHLSNENELSLYERLIMDGYFLLDKFSLSEEKAFGLDTSSVTVEKVPMVIAPVKDFKLKRIYK